MARRANSTLIGRVVTIRADLQTLENDLRNYGDKELLAAVQRAKTELMHTSVTGAENTFGVNADAVRR